MKPRRSGWIPKHLYIQMKRIERQLQDIRLEQKFRGTLDDIERKSKYERLERRFRLK